MKKNKPAEVLPVGEFIKDELIERGLTVRQLAEKMNGDTAVNLLTLQIVIYVPKKGVWLDTETAQGLALVFGTSSEMWMNLDRSWQES